MEPIVTSYAGLLDQSGFRQWYKYQKLRAAYGYDAEEVSFLMGKPSFYFCDYEMMETGTKLTFEDESALSAIFCRQQVETLDFADDEFGVFEKRIIRIRRTESAEAIDYLITTPWRLKGKSKAARFKIHEEKRGVKNGGEEAELRRQIDLMLDKLLSTGFFRYGRSGLEVYHEVEARSRWSPYLRPRYVKQAAYQKISADQLSLKANNGQLYFQGTKLNAMQRSFQKSTEQML